MHIGKEILRQKLRTQRRTMNQELAAQKCNIIAQKLMDSVDWNSVKKLHIYSSVDTWNEVDTKQIISDLKVRYPQIDISTHPANKNALIPSGKYDLVIVPVLGFDKDNYRLGVGGGWYDRFLAGQTQARTIGLAYNSAKVDDLPHEQHDIALDTIITEV